MEIGQGSSSPGLVSSKVVVPVAPHVAAVDKIIPIPVALKNGLHTDVRIANQEGKLPIKVNNGRSSSSNSLCLQGVRGTGRNLSGINVATKQINKVKRDARGPSQPVLADFVDAMTVELNNAEKLGRPLGGNKNNSILPKENSV
ncbi:hypothetical protein V6N13_037524 [Hibiscus sabdariffa]|uniref:Uncharacterized protein n=1 Tax=Hibiscus sabdariffa TaxID=183260 RepID=A0ABR2S5R9_9ROSI